MIVTLSIESPWKWDDATALLASVDGGEKKLIAYATTEKPQASFVILLAGTESLLKLQGFKETTGAEGHLMHMVHHEIEHGSLNGYTTTWEM